MSFDTLASVSSAINAPTMFVCLCKPVTDSQIRVCATDGCASFREMATKLGVAQQCGRCACHAKAVFDEARSNGNSDAQMRTLHVN